MSKRTFISKDTKSLRQLRFLSTTLKNKVKSGKANRDTIARIQQRITAIVYHLKSRVRMITIRKVMGTAFAVLGLMVTQNAQAQIFSDPIDLPQLPNNGVLLPELADLDNDGDLDVIGITINYDIDSVVVPFIENPGELDFQSIDIDTIQLRLFQQNLFNISSGDMDNDGDIDILGTVLDAYGTYGDYDVLFYENIGELAFAEPDTVMRFNVFDSPTLNNFVTDLEDIDGDGDLDLLSVGIDIAKYGQYQAYFVSMVYFENSGTVDSMSLQAPSIVEEFPCQPFQGGLNFFEVDDFDSDGDLDVFLFPFDGYTTTEFYFENTGDEFAAPVNLEVLPQDSQIYLPASGDLDGDGDPDLLFEAYSQYGINTNLFWVENLGISSTRNLADFGGSISLPTNMVTSDVLLDIELESQTQLQISILSRSAEVIYNDNRDIRTGQLKYDVNSLPAGLYLIRIAAQDRLETLRFYKE